MDTNIGMKMYGPPKAVGALPMPSPCVDQTHMPKDLTDDLPVRFFLLGELC